MTHTSKKKSKAKTHLALALVLAVSLTTACANNDVNSAPPAVNNESGTNDPANNSMNNEANNPTNDHTPSDDNTSAELPDPGVAEPNSPANNGGEQPGDTGVVQAEGTFNGLVDGHTVELETPNGPVAYQHDETLADSLSGLEQNDKVKYEYEEREYEADGETYTQLWLTKIEKVI